jgi:hypothetical protein
MDPTPTRHTLTWTDVDRHLAILGGAAGLLGMIDQISMVAPMLGARLGPARAMIVHIIQARPALSARLTCEHLGVDDIVTIAADAD